MQRKNTYTIPDGFRELVFDEQGTVPYRGIAKIHPNAYLSDHCFIGGDVRIGDHAVIYYGAVLRADGDYIEIGQETNVQEHCIIHQSKGHPVTIGEHTTIGHGAIIHGCTIGDNSLIGMNSVVLDDAVIGNNCIIGAGAVVGEGMVIPDNSLAVGVPAKIKKTVTQEQAVNTIQRLTIGNLFEAERMIEEGIMFHPTPELLAKLGCH